MRGKLATVLAIMALAGPTVTAASAGTTPLASPTPTLSPGQPIPPSHLTPAPPPPPGFPVVGPPLRIIGQSVGHADRTSSVVGYAICLYHSPNNCLTDTGNPDIATTIHPNWFDIIGTVGGGITIIKEVIVPGTKKIYKAVKRFFYKGGHTYATPDDGYCMSNFSNGGQVAENSCGDHNGISWYFHVTGKISNTSSSGYLAAPSNTHGYVYADNPIPYGWWYTWAERKLISG